MTFKKLIAKIKELFTKWNVTLKAFIRHPIQYTKDYFQNFKELSTEEKIKKIVLAVVFVAASVYAFYLVVSLVLAFIMVCALVGSGNYEIARTERAQWMVSEYGGKESDYL